MFLTTSTLQRFLNNDTPGEKISIFMPTHPSSNSQAIAQDCIRFKNALQQIKASPEYDEHVLGKTVKKLENLLDDTEFWKHRSVGLAVFADQNGYQTVELSLEPIEQCFIREQFVISPLAIMASIGTGYYILDVNLNKPRLLYFTNNSQKEITVESMPGSFQEMVKNVEYQKQLQHQSTGGGMFHGHSDDNALEADTAKYLKVIADSVSSHLQTHDDPLLLSGTQDRISKIRPLLTYKDTLEEILEGNNENLNEQQLRVASSSIINELHTKEHDHLIEALKSAPDTSTVAGEEAIKQAIEQGRVDTLYIPSYRKTNDGVNGGGESSILLQLSEKIEIIESIIRGTLLQGGSVAAIQLDAFDSNESQALCRF